MYEMHMSNLPPNMNHKDTIGHYNYNKNTCTSIKILLTVKMFDDTAEITHKTYEDVQYF
jgi:hypothetical protein